MIEKVVTTAVKVVLPVHPLHVRTVLLKNQPNLKQALFIQNVLHQNLVLAHALQDQNLTQDQDQEVAIVVKDTEQDPEAEAGESVTTLVLGPEVMAVIVEGVTDPDPDLTVHTKEEDLDMTDVVTIEVTVDHLCHADVATWDQGTTLNKVVAWVCSV